MASLTSTFDTTDRASPGYYGPSETALLLLDFHGMFVNQIGGSEARAALKVAAGLRTWAKKQGIQVIHCLMDLDATPYPTCKRYERLAGMIAALKASNDTEPAELLDDAGNDITFVRRPGHVSALKSPGFEEFLQEKGIKSLLLTGLSTSGCVMRTSVTACDAEYVVTTISDGCADPTKGVHDTMVSEVLNNRGYVATAAEFQEGFAKASEGR